VLDHHTLYRLGEWTDHTRTWVNQFTKETVIEELESRQGYPVLLAATGGSGKFEIQATLRGKKITAMLDCGASGNFISARAIARVNAPIKEIKLYELQVVDGTKVAHNNRIIT
jgi:predicted aspartyl protease